MILVGQYDSPFVRRVAISLRVLGFTYEHDTRSVFGDFDSMRQINPLGRIPSLVLDSGETLVESAAILDWLDEEVGPERALVPRTGVARREALQRIALATGAIEKFGGANYELLVRPSHLRWPEWVERCLVQGNGALAALEAMPGRPTRRSTRRRSPRAARSTISRSLHRNISFRRSGIRRSTRCGAGSKRCRHSRPRASPTMPFRAPPEPFRPSTLHPPP
jgi:glutathione S-transferase